MVFKSADWPSRSRPFATLAMTTAPRRPPTIRPRPPNTLVPPMTAAAIASRTRLPPPVELSTANYREVLTTSASAASAEQMVNTATRTAATLTPALRAASALPPTA